jgi:hypothetical protein
LASVINKTDLHKSAMVVIKVDSLNQISITK